MSNYLIFMVYFQWRIGSCWIFCY